ncbi:MAG: RpiB/LacA/LacB family sugar-phosphate isomerase [Candidatus Wolfebacteria bacterium]|nr:RpiB/LacA/LacB family sugar-phosphate isomerase [Candidatus Wolfebacteria bacterium]
MTIFIGADHRGFKIKEALKPYLKELGLEVVDLGNDHFDENDDYPDFANAVAGKVSKNPETDKGILICGSGIGMSIAANKFENVRAAQADKIEEAILSRKDNDANVLSLSGNSLSEQEIKEIVRAWLETPFSKEERHERRIKKIIP